MGRSNIVTILLLLSFSFGCNKRMVLMKDEERRKALEKGEGNSIVTDNDQEYNLYLPSIYTFRNDTIHAELKIPTGTGTKTISKRFAYHSIRQMEQTEIDAARTVLVVGFMVGTVYFLQNLFGKVTEISIPMH